MPAFVEFRLSITQALGDQLEAALKILTPEPLTAANLADVAVRPGVYQLYLGERLVYIGKAETSLPDRLGQHLRKLSGRSNVDLENVRFTCLYVHEDLSVVAPEVLLIARHRAAGEAAWNFNAFGNNDPGRERDTTTVRPGSFDATYPINLGWESHEIDAGEYQAVDLLVRIKRELPYVFRYEAGNRSQQNQPENYRTTTVPVIKTSPSAHELFQTLTASLPDSWQITALPGYAIMYREHRDYPSALRVYRH